MGRVYAMSLYQFLLILTGSDNGALHLVLLGVWTVSIMWCSEQTTTFQYQDLFTCGQKQIQYSVKILKNLFLFYLFIVYSMMTSGSSGYVYIGSNGGKICEQ
jgi:hypothetical protein